MQGYKFDWIGTLSGEPGKWLWDGFVTTLNISFFSIIFAMLLGIVVCVLRMSKVKPLVVISALYTEFFRNTPLLIQIYFWYFGASQILPQGILDWLNKLYYWFPGQLFNMADHGGRWFLFSGESMSCVIALTVYTSAFIGEEIRAGINSIPKNQLEASRAVGLSFMQAYRFVILPQAIRIVIPPLISQYLNLIKNSSLCMVIGVIDLTYQAVQIESYFSKPIEAFTYATILYLATSLFVSFCINMYNKHFMLQVRY